MKLGVITACYVYELSDYDASTPWNVAQGRFEESWTPEKLDELLGRIKDLGFGHVELWRGTGGFESWSGEELAAVRRSLDGHELQLAGYCVGGIDAASDVEGLFGYAHMLGAPMCTGYLTNEETEPLAERLARAGDKYDMSYGIENHGRQHTVADPEDILALAQRYPGRIGACPDTGIYYNDGTDPLAAVEALKEITIHTHLKDIDDTGSCALGEGHLPMGDIVRTLRGAGYSGVYSVEREGHGDPAAMLKRSCEFLRETVAGR